MKIRIRQNYRVEVFPEEPFYKEKDPEKLHQRMMRDLEILKASIERHCDIGDACTSYDSEEQCSFCGIRWEIDKETKEPACCNAAIDEFQKENPGATLENKEVE